MKTIIFTMTNDHLTFHLENWKKEKVDEKLANMVIDYVSDDRNYKVVKHPADDTKIMIYSDKEHLYDLLMYCCADYDVELM